MSLVATVFVINSSVSASVDLPWSMAMMEKQISPRALEAPRWGQPSPPPSSYHRRGVRARRRRGTPAGRRPRRAAPARRRAETSPHAAAGGERARAGTHRGRRRGRERRHRPAFHVSPDPCASRRFARADGGCEDRPGARETVRGGSAEPDAWRNLETCGERSIADITDCVYVFYYRLIADTKKMRETRHRACAAASPRSRRGAEENPRRTSDCACERHHSRSTARRPKCDGRSSRRCRPPRDHTRRAAPRSRRVARPRPRAPRPRRVRPGSRSRRRGKPTTGFPRIPRIARSVGGRGSSAAPPRSAPRASR